MAFYKSGESKYRPGVYMRFVNRNADEAGSVASAPVTPSFPSYPEPSQNMLLKDSRGVLFKTSDGYYLAVKN